MTKTEIQDLINYYNQCKSYQQTCERFKCSKSTVYYHVSEKGKSQNVERNRRFRSNAEPLKIKFEKFINRIYTEKENRDKNSIKKVIYDKISDFQRKGFKMSDDKFTYEDLVNKIGPNPRCYLTGEIIDLSKPKTYQLDHIIPKSRGGTNTIDNVGLCTKKANISKSNLTKDEYIELCKQVLINNGYKVI